MPRITHISAIFIGLFFFLFLGLQACIIQTSADGAFLQQLRKHCGEAFAGRVTSTDAADENWRAERIIMHIRDCKDEEVKIALHVGENRSRTWILRYEDLNKDSGQNTKRLALRHDHRHEDGSADAITYYGGLAADINPNRITFPADQATKDLFDRENIPISKTNIWAIIIDPTQDLFAYEMTRPQRNFKIEFDTSKAVETPPPAWGWAEATPN